MDHVRMQVALSCSAAIEHKRCRVSADTPLEYKCRRHCQAGGTGNGGTFRTITASREREREREILPVNRHP